MTTPADVHDVRDPALPGRLLEAERDELLPLLRSRSADDLALPVAACPGWTARDLLAHCAAAFTRVLEGRLEKGVFTAESNERDIAERAGWDVPRVLDELERGMTGVGPLIARADGVLDLLALGEWVHAGDLRETFGVPGAYAGAGLVHALPLLAQVTRVQDHLPLHADLDDTDAPLRLGAAPGDRTPARYIGPAPVLVRLYGGRATAPSGYELAGATAEELSLFGW
ncbi:maleylpyruvate isomerase family mycothiol-dependent enzyme [Streptomyces sp. SID8352]|uniref:maleylpyruvate isomerase family mycothiol-dependent enzyme n=1 Tax=Streptomyces sp. SID8352 TaxID=2690338 RepID=UPI00136ECD45|nr:maleylpyruvate isomerase family mycothiol-dependent enzyme [Streptomyces sp. SID8352]MYU20325.1 maleylpyruvate isomerase family mycothiol-dependent enzyme [Streptomyces sp. SID8352]